MHLFVKFGKLVTLFLGCLFFGKYKQKKKLLNLGKTTTKLVNVPKIKILSWLSEIVNKILQYVQLKKYATVP
jgi:hypothetical protein